MNIEKVCMGCMTPLNDGDKVCGHCGYPVSGVNPANYLPLRTVLSGRYTVGRVLEVGGDSAVYIGVDNGDDSRVTIREFFPPTLACRHTDGKTVVAAGGQKELLASCHSKFLTLARAVGRLRDLAVIVPSFDIFEENGTAYTVSEYCDGISLEKYMSTKGGKLPVDEVRRLFLPLIEAVSLIHATGVLHLALSPKNILVDSEGRLRIKNFAINEMRTQSGVGKPTRVTGCAAPEQYEPNTACTEAADVYGLAASMVFALTGALPEDATVRKRKGGDFSFPAESVNAIPAHIRDSLRAALALSPEKRTQTAGRLFDELSATQAVAALREPEKQSEPKKKKKFPYALLIFGVVLLALLAGVIPLLIALLNPFGSGTTTTTEQADLTMKPTTTTTKITVVETMYDVESLVGQQWSTLSKRVMQGDIRVQLKGSEYSNTVPKGAVISQIPAAGEKVARGTVITVVISAGPLENEVPNLRGWREEHARAYLEALGYNVGESLTLQVSYLEAGIVDGTEPPAGTKLKVGDTVRLRVSSGPAGTVVEE